MVYTLLAVISLVFVGLGLLKRADFNREQYFLAGHNSGGMVMAMCIAATWIGAASLIMVSEWVISHSMAALSYSILPAIGLLLVGLFLVPRIRKADSLTLSSMFELPALRGTLTVFFYLMYFIILSAQVIGFSKVFAAMGGGYTLGVVIAVAVITTYLSLGGFKSVCDTDVVQLCLIFLTLLVLVYHFGWAPDFVPELKRLLHAHHDLPLPVFYLVVMFIPAVMVLQDTHQRLRACASIGEAKKACFVAAAIMVVFSLMLGSIALQVKATGGTSILTALPELNPIYGWVAILGLFASSLSTADSAMNIAVSSAMAPLKYIRHRHIVFATIVTGLCAMVLANLVPSIQKLVLVGLNLYVGIMVPLMLAKYSKLDERLVLGLFVLSAACVIYCFVIKNPAPGLLAALLGSALVALGWGYRWSIRKSARLRHS